jgi:hypothetical protein
MVSERPANALGRPQQVEKIRFGLAGKQVGEARKAILNRCQPEERNQRSVIRR